MSDPINPISISNKTYDEIMEQMKDVETLMIGAITYRAFMERMRSFGVDTRTTDLFTVDQTGKIRIVVADHFPLFVIGAYGRNNELLRTFCV